jgi:hypothetical protein
MLTKLFDAISFFLRVRQAALIARRRRCPEQVRALLLSA